MTRGSIVDSVSVVQCDLDSRLGPENGEGDEFVSNTIYPLSNFQESDNSNTDAYFHLSSISLLVLPFWLAVRFIIVS